MVTGKETGEKVARPAIGERNHVFSLFLLMCMVRIFQHVYDCFLMREERKGGGGGRCLQERARAGRAFFNL